MKSRGTGPIAVWRNGSPDPFIEAIRDRKLLRVTFRTRSGKRESRVCIPLDYGPARRASQAIPKFHFYDLSSPRGKHWLTLGWDQVIDMEWTGEYFSPLRDVEVVHDWFVPRDW